MPLVETEIKDGIARIVLNRGKVNAINMEMVDHIRDAFEKIREDDKARSIVFTGNGKFFSFGFDIPELLTYTREDFVLFLTNFTDLYSYIYLYPKPVIGALNGHTIAGGCMLALACDFRIMMAGKGKIGLNEVNIGASVFAGAAEMTKFLIGGKNAHEVLLGGEMLDTENALRLGLVDKVVPEERFVEEIENTAREYAGKNQAAFASIKRLIRQPVADQIIDRETDSINEFTDIWYTEESQRTLREVKIRN